MSELVLRSARLGIRARRPAEGMAEMVLNNSNANYPLEDFRALANDECTDAYGNAIGSISTWVLREAINLSEAMEV